MVSSSKLVSVHETASGPMLLLDTDTVICKKIVDEGDYATEEKELLGHFIEPGHTVVDAGANIGNHTLFFAGKVGPSGKVFSFEAQRFLFQILCGNVALNSFRNVWCIPKALGREIGPIEVPVPNYSKPNNYGGYSLDFATFKEPGNIATLDSVSLTQCDLVKIDVEGMELDVLLGASQTIHTFQPILYLENNRPDKEQALLGFIASELEYRVYKHGPNVLCVPKNNAALINKVEAALQG